MSLRSWIATTVSFGLTTGLAGVWLMRNGWSLEGIELWVWAPMAAAVALSGVALIMEWATWLVGATVALLVTAVALLPAGTWAVPVIVGAIVLSLARFSGMYVHSRWFARGVGAAAGVGLLWLLAGGLLGAGGPDIALDALAFGGLAALAGMVAVTWVYPDDDEA